MSYAGATCPVQSIRACVVYDATSGRIHHVHRVLTLVGGREPAEDQIAADALRAMGGLPEPPTGALEVLHVHHSAVEPGKRYRVDVATKALVVNG